MPAKRRPSVKRQQTAAKRAVRLLALRALSRQELEARLLAAGHSESEVAAALHDLERQHLLDDRNLADAVVRQRGFGLGYGRLRLWADLRRRGVPREQAEEAMAASFDAGAEEELALAVGRRRARSRRGSDPQALSAQVGSFLSRRGFSEAATAKALRRLHLEGTLGEEDAGAMDL